MDEERMSPASAPAERPRRKRKKRSSSFWRGVGIFSGVLVLFWAVIIGYVFHCLVTYEAAQPERVVEEVARGLQEGGDGQLQFSYSRFESAEDCEAAYAQLLKDSELTVQKSPASYDAQAPVYDVYAQDAHVATVSLRETDSRSLMFILTLQEWEVTSVQPTLGAQEPYVVTVPEGYQVRFNGVELDERERTGNRYEIEEFQYAANYVAVPALVEYKVEGLVREPAIEILDSWGKASSHIQREGNTLRVDTFESAEMDSELEAYVLKNAKDYSNFFSGDLPGSGGSINPIRPMFPADSYYLDLAENYRLHDMWMYSNHNPPTFSDEEVSNYIPYTEDFFSCEVYFDKKMVLRRTGEDRHDITHTRYYYVKIDGKWLIADMQQILDQDQ